MNSLRQRARLGREVAHRDAVECVKARVERGKREDRRRAGQEALIRGAGR